MTGDPGSDTRPSLILFAEDEAPVRDMLVVALRLSGYRSVPCCDGQDAVERLAIDANVALVLVDLRMPRLDGLGVIRHVRATPSLADLPVVAMSAYSDDLQQRAVTDAGANAFVPKPFTIQQLVTVIDRFVPRP